MSVAVVSGVGRALPETVVRSSEVEARVASVSEGDVLAPGLIQLASGVKQRRYADPGVVSSDLAAAAARQALTAGGIDPASVDMLIFAAASQDVAEPATANMVQQKSGCLSAAVVDVKNACNSFLSGLDYACAAIETGRANRVLVAAGEVLSSCVEMSINTPEQLETRMAGLTLGDAGAAFVVSAAPDDSVRRIHPGLFESDGSHWGLSTVMGGGTLMGRDASRLFFECHPGELQGLALAALPPLMRKAAASVGWDLADVDLIVPHQVSLGIIKQVGAALDIPLERCVITIDRFGNTAAASIPLAVATAVEEGRLKQGDRVLLVGGAAGFSAGVVPVVW